MRDNIILRFHIFTPDIRTSGQVYQISLFKWTTAIKFKVFRLSGLQMGSFEKSHKFAFRMLNSKTSSGDGCIVFKVLATVGLLPEQDVTTLWQSHPHQ